MVNGIGGAEREVSPSELEGVSGPEGALSSLREAIAAEPRDVDARFHYALALEATGQWDDAEREYRAVTEICPERSDAYVHYADMLRKVHRLEDAEAQYRKAITANPADFRAHFSFATMLEEEKRLEEAEDEYVSAVCGPHAAECDGHR
ncbi:MAG TPA: tetratricopeptide repeat protein [Methanocella sp.]|nr:tetratricopeptide repeat protein [Methanocella sp.]